MAGIKFAASLLGADPLRLADQIKPAEAAGVDYLHCDVMDGRFVPNLSFGTHIAAAIGETFKTPLDVHLMVENPETFLGPFAEAGAKILTVHQEAGPNLHRRIQEIRDLGCQVGVCVNPATSVDLLKDVLMLVDRVLIMTVNPGYGGQSFLPFTLQKIQAAAAYREQLGAFYEIAVDGGITNVSGPQCVSAGADVLIIGHYLFAHPNGPQGAIASIKAGLVQEKLV